jgi:scyllo-inositol 2-dehydrogenase (NADP+)
MEKIKTALCAFGMSGRVFHAPFIQLHQGFELIGAYERSTNVIQQYYPKAKSFDNLEELLQADVDLIIVNTPTNTHYDIAREALIAEKHVVVEKAFTTTVGEASGLIFLAEQQKKMLSVFQNRRWDSDFLTVKDIIEQGILGEICEVEFHFDRYNLALSPKKHKEQPGPGAGILNDLGPHIIDQALYLFGMPNQVFADIRITRQHSMVDDYFDILLYYPNMRLRLKAGYLVHDQLPAYIIHGTEGSFLKPRADVQETQLQLGKKPNITNWGTEDKLGYGTISYNKKGKVVKEKIKSKQGNYYDYYDGIYKAIAFGNKPPVTGNEGLNVIKIIEAANRSFITKAVVNL